MSSYKKVGIDRIGDTLSKELATYSADVQMGVRLLVDEKSKELKNAIKKEAPVGYRKNIANRSELKSRTKHSGFTKKQFMRKNQSIGLHTFLKKLVKREVKKAERYSRRCTLLRQQRKFTANLKPE